MKMLGYHGTLFRRWKIIEKSSFIPSSKDTEWLGKGIYFFTNYWFANKWAHQEVTKDKNIGEKACVIQATIVCDNWEYVDLDIPENMEHMNQVIQKTIEKVKSHGLPKFRNHHQQRCYFCNLYKQLEHKKVLSYTFPIRIHNNLGFPFEQQQRQICIDNDSYIVNTEVFNCAV